MRKNKKQVMEKVNKFLTNPALEDLSPFLIIDTAAGYELFGEFTIAKENNMHVVTKHTTDLEVKFYSQRNAVVWTTLYFRDNIGDANRVRDLDKILEGTNVNIEVHQQLYLKTSDIDKKLIYFAKLQEDKLKKKQLVIELDRFALNSKRWQNSRFDQVVK